MKLFQFGALVLLAATLIPAKVRAADVNLEGAWVAARAERNGAPASELIGNRLSFEGSRFRISKDESLIYGGSFSVSSGMSPAQIDFAVEKGTAKGQSWLGIVKVENEMLTICDNAPDPKAPRPAKFGTSAGSNHVCLTFRR